MSLKISFFKCQTGISLGKNDKIRQTIECRNDLQNLKYMRQLTGGRDIAYIWISYSMACHPCLCISFFAQVLIASKKQTQTWQPRDSLSCSYQPNFVIKITCIKRALFYVTSRNQVQIHEVWQVLISFISTLSF